MGFIALGMAYLAVHVTDKKFCEAVSHPPPLHRDICDIDYTSYVQFCATLPEYRLPPTNPLCHFLDIS